LEEQLGELSPRSRRKNTRVLRPLAIGASILALLLAGIFIGLSLNRQNLGFQQKIADKNPVKNSVQPIVHPSTQQLPAPAANTAPTTPPANKPKDSVPNIINSRVAAIVPPVTKPPRTVTPKERPGAPKKGAILPPVTKDSAAGMNPNTTATVAQAVHRPDVVETKSENKSDKETAKTSIASQVSVGANGYTVGTFGGINDLQLTVTNHSAYPLDLVVVEIQYIQANKKVYKTENLYFRNIGAGSALMQEAPRTSRGIKVRYKITTINSKDLGLSYSGI
ncbi:MAG TPA: hypothetical protein VKQ52_03595, partial [Puia sp.]|nr:hypothetical protein [Puia sp.]